MLERVRAHLVGPARLFLDLFVPGEGDQRIAAPLVELRTVALADGTRIALRSETTMDADARLARTVSRYVHRRGHALIAEESETTSYTWYAPDDVAALVRAAGYVDVDIGDSPRESPGAMNYALSARSTAAA